MKNIVLFFVIVFSTSQVLTSQEDWLTIDFKGFNIPYSSPKNIVNVFNDVNGNTAVFFFYPQALIAYLYNDEKILINKVLVNGLPKYSSNYFGCSNQNNRYTLFFKNRRNVKFSSLTIDFESGISSYLDALGFSFKKETFVQSFESDNNLYVLSVVNNSSILKLYTLNCDNSFDFKEINLSSYNFNKPNGISTNLSVLIKGINKKAETTTIKVGEPSSLDIASSRNKLYYHDNVITLTSNYFVHCTYVIDINVLDGSYKFSKFDNIYYKNEEDLWTKANSFIDGKHFFYMHIIKEGLVYEIYNRTNKELIKTLTIKKDNKIEFKNSPIILEGGELKDYRELDKAAQFLRKIRASNISTCVHKADDKYVINIGSSEPNLQSHRGYYFGGGIIGGLIGVATYQLLIASFDSHISTKSTRIECLFDEDFKHIEGDIPLNSFDRIKNYLDRENLNEAPLQTIFKLREDYIFGYYNKSSNKYRYVKI